jgi:hypothetical protein
MQRHPEAEPANGSNQFIAQLHRQSPDGTRQPGMIYIAAGEGYKTDRAI